MRVLYKLVMSLCGSLCALIMLVVGEPTIAGVLAACVLLVLGLVLIWLHLQWGRFLRFMGWS